MIRKIRVNRILDLLIPDPILTEITRILNPSKLAGSATQVCSDGPTTALYCAGSDPALLLRAPRPDKRKILNQTTTMQQKYSNILFVIEASYNDTIASCTSYIGLQLLQGMALYNLLNLCNFFYF